MVVMVFGVIAYATAETAVVSATVNPKIELTIAETTATDWSSVTPGTPVLDKVFTFTVKSNKAWNFTNDSVVYAPDDGLLDAILSEAYAGDFQPADTGIAKGVKTATGTYSLDMTADAAYDLDPAPTSYPATYTYTAAQ